MFCLPDGPKKEIKETVTGKIQPVKTELSRCFYSALQIPAVLSQHGDHKLFTQCLVHVGEKFSLLISVTCPLTQVANC